MSLATLDKPIVLPKIKTNVAILPNIISLVFNIAGVYGITQIANYISFLIGCPC